jgi:prepilin-type N-terminal cleavage/methylation domain-containing protein
MTKKQGTLMRRHKQHAGFSLLELTVSIAVLLIISGATFSALNFSQKAYASQQLQADVHAGLRGTFALLAQEVGQAGSLNFIPQTLSAAVTGGTVAQTVQLSSTANIFVGEELTVDTGSNQELVQVISFPGTNQISGIFRQNHALAAPVTAQGVFPNGVLTTTAGNTLQLFGDVNADGSLEYVEYDCNPGSTSAPGTLTRSITTIAPG